MTYETPGEGLCPEMAEYHLWLRLHNVLDYNPLSGVWTWKIPLKGQKSKMAGSVAYIKGNGRRFITFDRNNYYSARLAWFYMTGEWPLHEIDHINRDSLDDSWHNLQDVTHQENCRNR
jgi:hypothetical protein